MLKKINSNVSDNTYEFDLPTVCPHCNKGIAPVSLYEKFSKPKKKRGFIKEFLDIILYCPICDNRFFASFLITDKKITSRIGVYPTAKPVIKLPDILLDKYPDFIEAYRQAAVAESHGLNPLCGIGYRRALEILIKQHLIGLHPEEQDKIMGESLSQSYSRLNDTEKALARGAAWLGNDYAHMVNKHPDYDIDDLKNFIHALSYLIAAYLTAEEADNVPRA